MKLKKRILSLLLCGAMLFSLCSQSVLAEENGQAGGVTIGTSGLCEHHPEHNADCGYTAGTAGTPCVREHTADCYEEVTNCVHEHDEDCYPEESVSGNEATPSGAQKREPTECTHACSEQSGCITKELNCQHEHDDECGYSPAAEGTPCGYVCELCGAGDNTPSNAEAVTVASVQAMINALPSAEAITEENAEEVKAQLEAIDEAKEKLSDEEIDELDMTRYAEAAAALGALAAPMLLANDSPDEQFSLTPGITYWFDLPGTEIPGEKNDNLPDKSLHWVPFTYVGTINAYSRSSEGISTEDAVTPYNHSLFIADYNVTHTVSWDDLNTASLIFGKNYASYGVDYTLRAPSVGSGYTGSGDSERGTPSNNEWDTMLNKNSGYVKNWNTKYSWGQDTSSDSASRRAYRGCYSARLWDWNFSSNRLEFLGFRPVLEVLNPDTLGSDGLKVVTLDLNGGKLGGSSEAIQIIVKNGSKFTAPASGGLTRPDGDAGSFFMWLDGNGKSYEPGDSVPADVTELTVQWTAPTYAVTLNTNGGTINSGNVTGYTYGVGATLPIADDMTYTGHTFKGWYDNESLTGSPVTAIGDTETGNKEYWAKWEINQYTITYDLAGGTVEGNPDTYTIKTGAFTLKNPTKSGYTFTGWSGTGLDGENNMTVTIPKGSTGERRYTAHWRYNGGSSGGSSSYPITVPSKTENGTVTVSPKNASAGSTVTITVKPDSGYVLETISVTDKNGNDLKLTDKGNGKYTFTMPASKVEIKVTFMEDNSVLNFFYDVPNDAYYYEAVKWAAENGITGGIGSSLFAPNQPCTRAQIVTFLWRAAGSPVVNYLMPFTDVDEGAYYAEAVRWAASTGIVTGLTETTFGTNGVCTRAQAAAMIYRCAQAQGKGFTGAWMFHLPFTDVPEWAYESVAWCYMNGVTTGMSETSFAPDNDCTRAQIVTFLWRAFSK